MVAAVSVLVQAKRRKMSKSVFHSGQHTKKYQSVVHICCNLNYFRNSFAHS